MTTGPPDKDILGSSLRYEGLEGEREKLKGKREKE